MEGLLAAFPACYHGAFSKKRTTRNQTKKGNCENMDTPTPGQFFGLDHEHRAGALNHRCITSAQVQGPEYYVYHKHLGKLKSRANS